MSGTVNITIARSSDVDYLLGIIERAQDIRRCEIKGTWTKEELRRSWADWDVQVEQAVSNFIAQYHNIVL